LTMISNLKLPKITPRSKQILLVELRNAVQVWLILYGIMFVALLGYRYNTQRYYLNKQQQAAAAAAAAIASTSSSTTTATSLLYQKYQAPLQTLTEEVTTAQNVIQSKLNALEKYKETLETMQQSTVWQDLPPIQRDDNDLDNVSLDHWKTLMTTSKLQDVTSDEEVASLFENSIRELNAIVSSPERVDWDQVNQMLEQVIALERHHRDFTCAEQTGSSIPKDAAREQDLQEVLQKFDKLFSKRMGGAGVQALLPETRKEVEDITLSKVENMLQDIATAIQALEEQIQHTNNGIESAATTNDAAASSACDINLEMVTALVDAGLKAMAVHGDVREALHKTVRQYDSTAELILDADLPPVVAKETMPASTVINVRDVIDSPLLIKSMDWIDDLVDLVGGYNDKLDQYLDTLSNRNSVGEVVVEKILKRAGLIDIDVSKLPPTLQRKILKKYG
jgi:rubrerythrin